jgi:hypothetical protein
MSRWWACPQAKVLAGIAFGLIAAKLAYRLKFDAVGTVLSASIVILLGWAVVGHLVTIDDDMPGEWSNPAGSKSIGYRSLLELLVKVLVFVAAILVLALDI